MSATSTTTTTVTITAAPTLSSPEELLQESLENLLQRSIEPELFVIRDSSWGGDQGPKSVQSPPVMEVTGGDAGPKNLDPWGFEALAVARGRGTAPTSLFRFAHEVGRGTADWEAKHADFRSRYLVWVQEVMHPRAQCWGASFWENFENGVSRDWQQAVAYAYDRLCLIDEGILTQGHHVQAQWWAGFWGTEGYPLPSVPSAFLPYREKHLECFPHLQDGLTLDRQGSQRREDWVLRNRDGAVVVPGMLKPLPGWAKGPNPGTTDRWRKEVEQNFRSPRPGGRWRW